MYLVLCRDDSFRLEFARLGEIRTLIPSEVRVMALTATATTTTLREVITCLCVCDPTVIYPPPTKSNIMYSCKPKSNMIKPICSYISAGQEQKNKQNDNLLSTT